MRRVMRATVPALGRLTIIAGYHGQAAILQWRRARAMAAARRTAVVAPRAAMSASRWSLPPPTALVADPMPAVSDALWGTEFCAGLRSCFVGAPRRGDVATALRPLELERAFRSACTAAAVSGSAAPALAALPIALLPTALPPLLVGTTTL
jgi:hypothetical protein